MPFDWLKSLKQRLNFHRSRRRNDRLAHSLSPCEPRILLSVDPIGVETRANTYTSASQDNAAVAIDSDGDYVVTWESYDQDGNYGGIYAQRYNAAGTPLGSEFRVNTTTIGNQSSPAIGIDADGDFVVTWTSYVPYSGYGIYAQRYNASGTALGSEFRVNTNTAYSMYSPAIGVDADGDFIVTWQSEGQDGGGSGIYAQRYNASGAPLGSEFRVNTHTTGDQVYPAIAMNADGNFVLTWQSRQQEGEGAGIYARRYNASGTPLESEFLVNSTTMNDQISPSIGIDADGDFVITWTSKRQDGSGYGIYAQRYNASGTAQGSEFRVNTHTISFQSYSTIGMDADGDFLITWQSNHQDGSDYGIYAQRYDYLGIASGSEFRVNSTTLFDQSYPSIEVGSNGDFIIAWQSYGQDGDSYGVYTQRYRIINAPPSAVEDTAATPEETTRIIDVLANDTDPDTPHTNLAILPGSLGFRDANGVFHPGLTVNGGTVSLRPDGRVNYTPAPNFNGPDSFEYETSDGIQRPSLIGGQFQVNTATGITLDGSSSVAVAADGEIMAIWGATPWGGGGSKIYSQLFGSDGTKIGSEFLIDPSGTDGQHSARIVADSLGGFFVVWMGRNDGETADQIFARRFGGDGQPIGNRIVVNDPGSYETSSIAVGTSGELIVVWSKLNSVTGKYEAFGRIFDQAGTPLIAEFVIGSDPLQNSLGPLVSISPDGGYTVVWSRSTLAAPLDVDVVGQRFDSNGDPIADEFQIDRVGDSRYAYSMEWGQDGRLFVFMRDANATSSSGVIYGELFLQVISPDGVLIGDPVPVNTTTTGVQTEGAAVLDPSTGEVIAVWHSDLPGQTEDALFGQRFDPSGLKIGPEFRISQGFSVSGPILGLAADPSGNVIATWIGIESGQNGVQARWIDRQNHARVTVNVTPVNDAPVLNNNGNPLLNPVTLNAPAANIEGTLVSDIIARMTPGGGITDPDAGALQGIAINGLASTNGTWEFTIDNGNTWSPIGTTGNTNARLLAADDITRIRFLPNANFIGEAKLAFAAWDRSSGTNGSVANVSTRGGSTPYSLNYDYASVFVVNTAPVLNPNGNPTLDPVSLTSLNIPGTLVSDLISRMAPNGGISDTNPGALRGIAINGLGNTSSGTWQYTVNNGTNWTTIGTTGNSNARLLAADPNTRIRFIPNAGFLGEAKLAFVAWDRTTGSNGGVANVNNRGGSTPYSLLYEYASLFVVNSAPVLTPSNASTLDSIPMNVPDASNPGTLVSDIIARMAPGGINDPNPGALTGIAINGLSNIANGTWQYTINNGSTWSTIGTTGNSNARLLAANANTRIRFVPNTGFTGTVKLAFVAWDQTSGTNGGITNVASRGGTTPFSLAYDYASLNIV